MSPNPKTGILVQKISLETDTVEMKAKMERCLYKALGYTQVSVSIRPKRIHSSSFRENQPTDSRPWPCKFHNCKNATCC